MTTADLFAIGKRMTTQLAEMPQAPRSAPIVATVADKTPRPRWWRVRPDHVPPNPR